MPLPQLDDGYTRIANEIIDHLARLNLSAYESRTLWALLRKTYGWNRVASQISITQFQRLTGLDRRNQVRTIETLRQKNIITVTTTSFVHSYRFQKNFDLWQPLSLQTIRATVVSTDNSTVVSTDNKTVVCRDTPKRQKTIKEKGGGDPLTQPTPLFSFKNASEKAKAAWAMWPVERRGTFEEFTSEYSLFVKTEQEHSLLIDYMKKALSKAGQDNKFAYGYQKMFRYFTLWHDRLKPPVTKEAFVKEHEVMREANELVTRSPSGFALRVDVISRYELTKGEQSQLKKAILRAGHTARMISTGNKKQTLYTDEIHLLQKYLPAFEAKVRALPITIVDEPASSFTPEKITKTDINTALNNTVTNFTIP